MIPKLSKGEWIAAALVCALIWVPLAMAPCVSNFGGELTAHNCQQQEWRRIISDARPIEWLTLLVLFAQSLIFGAQARIADKQTTLVHQNYLLTHRPKLRVRNIVIKGSLFGRNQDIYGQFYVDNIGGTNAYVTESHCEFLWNTNGLPMERPYEGKDANNPLSKGTLIVGSLGVTGIFSSFPNLYPDIDPPGTEASTRAFFMGWIEYLDDAGLKRRTIFCREFLQRDGSARFWRIKDDPDYEYEQ